MSIFREALRPDAEIKFKLNEKALRSVGITVRDLKDMSPSSIEFLASETKKLADKKLKESSFDMNSPRYLKHRILLRVTEAFSSLAIEKRRYNKKVTPGQTYYKDIVIEGNRVKGFRKKVSINGKKTFWKPFNEDARVMKADLFLEHGSDVQFAKIYVDMADGKPKVAPRRFDRAHIVESSDHALDRIETYCESQWSGQWPWQKSAPPMLLEEDEENCPSGYEWADQDKLGEQLEKSDIVCWEKRPWKMVSFDEKAKKWTGHALDDKGKEIKQGKGDFVQSSFPADNTAYKLLKKKKAASKKKDEPKGDIKSDGEKKPVPESRRRLREVKARRLSPGAVIVMNGAPWVVDQVDSDSLRVVNDFTGTRKKIRFKRPNGEDRFVHLATISENSSFDHERTRKMDIKRAARDFGGGAPDFDHSDETPEGWKQTHNSKMSGLKKGECIRMDGSMWEVTKVSKTGIELVELDDDGDQTEMKTSFSGEQLNNTVAVYRKI